MNTTTTNNTNTSDNGNVPARKSASATVAAVTVKPVNPFAVTCRFDRARGAFVVQAGARAGACAVLAFAVLAAGTFGFVRTTLRGPSTAVAADLAAESDAAAEESPVIAAQPKSFSEYVRTPGLNYLIIQSYPNKKAADKGREALIRKGVATTVERSLPGWSGKGWYSLVGMTGFELEREQNLFDRHMRELKALKLDPKPYKWRGTDANGPAGTVTASPTTTTKSARPKGKEG